MKGPPVSNVLPVAIMAHNEEKVIAQAIQSCFEQICPIGYSINVIVVANGCTDATEDIVLAIAKQYQGALKLISMSDKGKTIALNRAIECIKKDNKNNNDITYVVFMDADCEFVGNEVILNFIKTFEETPSLCAVGATNVPKLKYTQRAKLVSSMYRATDELNILLPENGISGGAYCIKLDILQKLKFPEIQMADDMYVSMKLDGWMLRNNKITVSYSIPVNLRGELKKRIRHEIAIHRYFEYYKLLLKSGSQTALFANPLDDKYRWRGFSSSQALRNILKVKSTLSKILICVSITIRLLAKIIAFWKLRKLEKNPGIDYWSVER